MKENDFAKRRLKEERAGERAMRIMSLLMKEEKEEGCKSWGLKVSLKWWKKREEYRTMEKEKGGN